MMYLDDCEEIVERAVDCKQCSMNYCLPCDQKYHVGPKASHTRKEIEHDPLALEQIEEMKSELDDVRDKLEAAQLALEQEMQVTN